MTATTTYTAFAGTRRVAAGPLREVLPVLKERFDRDRSDLVLVFDVDTGRQVDFDLRGSLDDVLERVAPPTPRGPGRPRLGVKSREVSLLPRHWEWLERQQSGISAAIRRLVERATGNQRGAERARAMRAALSPFLSAMAGNRANFEEACRALYGGDTERFRRLIQRWPKDIREFALERANAAAAADDGGGGADPDLNARRVLEVHEVIWNHGDYAAIERLIAPRYTIHSDPGDRWEGQTLDRKTYEQRVRYSRAAFPDLVFTVHDRIAAGQRVSVRWTAQGTHAGDLTGLPATGKRVTFSGQTLYELRDGQLAGHWQVVDRLGFIQQVGVPDPGRTTP